MPQISKKLIEKDKLDKIFVLFFDLIADISNKNEAEMVINEILTSTEKIMIAKRIACFYLISKQIPPSIISEAIKLSSSTIDHYYYLYQHSNIIKEFVSKKLASEKVYNLLKNIFVEIWYGMPRKGADWGYQKRQYIKHKQQLEEPI